MDQYQDAKVRCLEMHEQTDSKDTAIHADNFIYLQNFNPAFFLAETRHIRLVQEIDIPGHAPGHHRKFRGLQAWQLELFCIIADKQTTARLSPSHGRVTIVKSGYSTSEWGGG